jgi:probable HAF family extracellular repeat protein
MQRVRFVGFGLVALAWLLAGEIAYCGQYTLTDLGTLGGTTSNGYDINNNGQVVGQSRTAGNSVGHAFLYSGGVMTDLGSGPEPSTAYSINDSGQAVGTINAGGSWSTAVLYSGGTMTSLGSGEGASINNSGQVAGYTTNTNPTRAFLYSNGVRQYLGTLGGSESYAYGINDAGQVVGRSTLANNYSHAFLYSDGSMRDLGTLGGVTSGAYEINGSGQVVGYSAIATGAWHAFLYSGGAMKDLGTLGGASSQALDINSCGQVVGFSNATGDSVVHAFLYSDGAMVDLNTLLSPGSGWKLLQATAINGLGQITGFGTSPSGDTHGFLLTPVPEPATLLLLGLGGIVLRRKR